MGSCVTRTLRDAQNIQLSEVQADILPSMSQSQVTKLLVGEMAVGIELPMYEEGAHDIQVMVCAATQEQIGSVLFVCEPKQVWIEARQRLPHSALVYP